MRRGTRYGALLGPLLAGGAPPGMVTRAARGLGLPERGRYAVVVPGTPAPDAAVVAGPDVDGARWWWGGGEGPLGRRGGHRAERREVAVVPPGPAGPARVAARLRELGAGPGGRARWWAPWRSWVRRAGWRVRRC
ncbi:hypothetical protein SBADM41S_08714 [Streptomyces badius]